MNSRTIVCCGAIALISLGSGPGIAAAEEHKCPHCAKHSSHNEASKPTALAYQAEHEGVFAGIIQSVMNHPGMDVELTIGAGEKTYSAVIAPPEWLDEMEAVFRPGERVEIVGARLDGDKIVAREIYTAGQTIVVRDADGRPLWK